MKKNQIQELLPLYTVIFLGFFGYALTITLFIPMLMNKTGMFLPISSSVSARVTISGFLLAMYPLGQFLGAPMIGSLSDYYGRKKVLLWSLLLCALGFAIIALSIELHLLYLLFISAFLTGLCESNMAISQTVIADKYQDAIQRNKYIGYAYSACSLGYTTGPLIGGAAGTMLGYSAPFWFTAFASFCVLIWVLYYFHDHYIPNKTTAIRILQSITALKSIFQQIELRKIYLINFLIFFAIQGLYRVAPLYFVDTWKPSLQVYSLLIASASLICLFTNLLILGQLTKRFTMKNLLIGLLFSGGLIMIGMVLPKHLAWFWLLFAIVMIPTVMALPTATTWLSHQAPAHQQGQALGNNQALLVLGEASSAAIGGLIAAIFLPLPIILMGIILLFAGIMVKRG